MIRTKIMDTSSGGCAMSTALWLYCIVYIKNVKPICAKERIYFCANCTKNEQKIVGIL